MALLSDLAILRARVAASPGRLEKRRLVADYLRGLSPEDLPRAVTYLSGRAFPASDPRVLNVRGLHDGDPLPGGESAPLTLADVAAAFGAVAEAAGPGARRLREARLGALAARASAEERDLLQRVIYGEMRMGLSDGLVLEAIAEAAGATPAAVRRAALVTGDLTAVASLALGGGVEALAAAVPRVFVPLLPMLAEIAADFDEALAAHGGRSALEYKYDGARIQLHRDGDRVAIWSRRMTDVTRSLPDIVTLARDLQGAPFILDGEVLALDAGGRPRPFQELMRRFRRVRGVEAAAAEMPLTLHLFDCLMADGRSLLSEAYTSRGEALRRVTGGRWLAEGAVITTAAEGEALMARALAAGHEGVMAKDPRSPYEPGGRGKRWFKLKAALGVDCVIVAADRGSGRRVGWLSNYHLAVRDGDGWADVGKTFKGLTDREFAEMTERLRALAVADDGYTVRVRPEVMVEVEYNEIQKSPTYASGLALRFARIARIREDKAPGQATTLAELRALYDRQFATKGRSEP